jgi:ComF family protein
LKLGHVWSGFVELLLPPACPLCLKSFPPGWNEPFCAACLKGFLPLPAARCPRCALPFQTQSSVAHLCERCSRSSPPFSAVYCLGLYRQTLRQAVQQFKFQQRIGLDRPLAQLLLKELPRERGFDLLVPVPLHPRRLRDRSYNQALLLSRELGRYCKRSVADRLLVRCQQTDAQHLLSAKLREANMCDAFRLQGRLLGERILLVDDVMTTGATVSACSRELLRGGAGEVHVAVVGRAPIGW